MNQTAEREGAVGDALRSMAQKLSDQATDTVEERVAGDAATEAVAEETVEETTEATADTTTSQGTETDDVASLKERLAEREASMKRYEERLSAINERNRQSLDAINSRAMRFASQRDRARQVLEKALGPDGVDKAEAERLLAEIRSGYNPQSVNYAPPEAPTGGDIDDRAIAVNEWLNDNGLTQDEATSFGAWLRNPANLTSRDQKIADTYSFLTAVAPRWREGAKTPVSEATQAAKTVSRVQKQAAKAASAGLGTAGSKVGTKTPASKSPRLSDEQLGGLIKEMWENR